MSENHSHGEESCSACATDIFEEKGQLWKQKEVVVIIVAAAIFVIGIYVDFGLQQHLLAQIAFLAATLTAGYSIIKKGFLGVIRKHRLDMNLLITIAAAGSVRHRPRRGGGGGDAIVPCRRVARRLRRR